MNVISRKKQHYQIYPKLEEYIRDNGRAIDLTTSYPDLRHFHSALPLKGKEGEDTLWQTVYYTDSEKQDIFPALIRIYALLKAAGDMSMTPHLSVSRVDFCEFGNSQPFRIRIINNYNDNYDYFYVKKADASRVYGLELEHLLSPNRINFFVDGPTLIEEHIAGIPGDQFLDSYKSNNTVNEIRLAKEFVKFNERCFIRLLGDMRSYNFVIDITQDFDDVQYRIRAIDFDQQSYEGRLKMYLPQFFKENFPFVQLCMKHMNERTISQYQTEERALIAKRLRLAMGRVNNLLDVMENDLIAPALKVDQLKTELADYYKDRDFTACRNMGEIVRHSLRLVLRKFSEDKRL